MNYFPCASSYPCLKLAKACNVILSADTHILSFFSGKCPFCLILFLTAHSERKSYPSFRSRLNGIVRGTAGRIIQGLKLKTGRFKGHKLFHLSKIRSRGDLIMVHKYLCEIEIPLFKKFIYREEKGIKRSNGWRLKPGKPKRGTKHVGTGHLNDRLEWRTLQLLKLGY